jgi:hypothetical protein
MIRGNGGTDTGRQEGTLRVTDNCVLLETTAEVILLVWPADRTTWDSDTHRVDFLNVDGTSVSAGDATHVVLGGGGESNIESGTTSEAWLSSMPWVQRPSDFCPLTSRWIVGAVEVQGP